MGCNDTGNEDRNLDVAVYTVRTMSKQWRKFSELTDPEDRNTERRCQVMRFLFLATSFPRMEKLTEESLPTASGWIWDRCSRVLKSFTYFCPIFLYRSNVNVVGLGIHFLQLIVWSKLYLLTPHFKRKVFFKGEKLQSTEALLFSKQFSSECQPPRWFAIQTVRHCHSGSICFCTVSSYRLPDPVEFGSSYHMKESVTVA